MPADGHGAGDPGGGGGYAEIRWWQELVDLVGDFLAGFFANVAADALSEEEQNDIDQREDRSTFSIFDVEETFVIEPEGWTVHLMDDNQGTFWFDMDRDGTPDTHARGTPDGGLYYDSNGDGNFDTNINHLVNPGP